MKSALLDLTTQQAGRSVDPESFAYSSRIHSARHTESYIFNQLIPYIGSKRKLLPLICRAIMTTGQQSGTLLDPFSGSGVVARLGKVMGFTVVASDWEPYSFHINRAFVECNRVPAFKGLGGVERAFDLLNEAPERDGYIRNHYCPSDDLRPRPDLERMFFTRENGGRIDAVRETIERWSAEGMISAVEESFLLAPLIYSVSYVSNTSGVFKAYHNGWGGSTGTALYRILSRLELKPPVLFDNGRENRVLSAGALDVLDSTEADIIYVDPPYNQHQYGSNYHLLNSVALWDKPPLNREVLLGGRTVNKAAIRTDWRDSRRSRFCYRETAAVEMERLLDRARAPHLVMSYSTDGIVRARDLIELFTSYGEVHLLTQRYKRYRVSSQRYSPRPHTVEFVLVLKRNGRRSDPGELIREVEAVASGGIT